MKFDPFEVSVPHIAYSLLGGFVVIFGMFSLWIKARLYISEAVWATLFGIIVGPYCAGIFDPRAWAGDTDTEEGVEVTNTVTLEVMRVVLAIGVFAIGVELPKAYLWRHVRSVLLILFPVMAWGWIVCAGLIYGLVPGLNFLSSLIIAACLTPTDPILASAVVGGKWADKHVPAHLRHLLAAESGVNDGLAFPFLYIALYLFLEDGNARVAVGEWIYWTILYEVTLGCVMGTVLGVGFRHLMQFCERKDLIDRTSYLAQYVSLALLAIGVTTLLGTDDLLCAFFAGTGFGWNGFFQKQTEDSMFSNAMDLLFNVAAFIYIGAWLPFASYADTRLTLAVWRLVVLGILVILVRRIPICLAVYTWIPDIKTFREALFTGHFGPMGVGAIFISTLAATQLPSKGALGDPPYSQEQLLSGSLQPIVSFIVLCSVLSHGLSVPAFSLSKRVHSLGLTVHTRSWSRQASRDGHGHVEPEWATQARRVHRPEDIVINRDSDAVDLEKGLRVNGRHAGEMNGAAGGGRMHGAGGDEGEEVGAMDRENEKPRVGGAHVEGGTEEVGVGRDTAREGGVLEGHSPAGTGTSGMTRIGDGEDLPAAEMEDDEADRERERREDGRGDEGDGEGEVEDVKEGEPSVSTWRQGNYMVIERNPGHGGDVEVEVVRRSRIPAAAARQTFRGRTLEEARALGREYVEKLEQKARQIRAELLREGKITSHQDQAKTMWGERTLRRLSGVSVESWSSEGGAALGEHEHEHGQEGEAGPSGSRRSLQHDREGQSAEGDSEIVPGLPAGEPIDENAVEDDDMEEVVEEASTTDPSPSSAAAPLPRTTLKFREPSSRQYRTRERERSPVSPETPTHEPHYPHHHSRFIKNAKRAIVHAAHGHGGHGTSARRSIRRSLLSGSSKSRNKSVSPPADTAGPSNTGNLTLPTITAHPERSPSFTGSQSTDRPVRPILTSATSFSSLRDSPAPSTNSSLPGSSVPSRMRTPSPTRPGRASSPGRNVRFTDYSSSKNGPAQEGTLQVPGSAPPTMSSFVPGTATSSEVVPVWGEGGNGAVSFADTTAANTAANTGSRVRFDSSTRL